MGLIRLFLYDQPMSMGRFLAELAALVILIALIAGVLAANMLAWLRQ